MGRLSRTLPGRILGGSLLGRLSPCPWRLVVGRLSLLRAFPGGRLLGRLLLCPWMLPLWSGRTPGNRSLDPCWPRRGAPTCSKSQFYCHPFRIIYVYHVHQLSLSCLVGGASANARVEPNAAAGIFSMRTEQTIKMGTTEQSGDPKKTWTEVGVRALEWGGGTGAT